MRLRQIPDGAAHRITKIPAGKYRQEFTGKGVFGVGEQMTVVKSGNPGGRKKQEARIPFAGESVSANYRSRPGGTVVQSFAGLPELSTVFRRGLEASANS